MMQAGAGKARLKVGISREISPSMNGSSFGMNDSRAARVIRWLFDPRQGATEQFLPRWLFLRAIGLIYFSAFFSLLFQIRGLIGPDGILPASEYLESVAKSTAAARFWYAPTVFWLSTSSHMLMAVCWIGLAASVLVVFNIFPRTSLFVCFVGFLSFVAAAGEFAGYQSDGMLLEAGFIVLFLAPMGFRPALGVGQAPIRASIFLLLWEWFRIYFESGVAKTRSGGISRRWTSITRTGRCRRGLDGTSSIFRTGFMRRRRFLRWRWNLCWFSCFFCRGGGGLFVFLL
jgi:hypothetical protein